MITASIDSKDYTRLLWFLHHSFTWKPFGLVESQPAAAETPLTQTELLEGIRMRDGHGEKEGVNQPALSTIVRKLEEYGYVKRENTPKGKFVSRNI